MKVMFWLLFGWWAIPFALLGRFVGDVWNCEETETERMERHCLED